MKHNHLTETDRVTKGLPYIHHVRFAIELGIAQSKLTSIQAALFLCYPEKIRRKLDKRMAWLEQSIRCLKDTLGNEVFRENKTSDMSLEAKDIYSDGLSSRIISHLGIELTIVPYDLQIHGRGGKKPNLTIPQYHKANDYLEEIKDLLCFLEGTMRRFYQHAPYLLKEAKLAQTNLATFATVLREVLIKEHGPCHEMFAERDSFRLFLDGSFTDISPSKKYLSRYIKARITADNEEYCRLDDELRERVAARSRQTPIRKDRTA